MIIPRRKVGSPHFFTDLDQQCPHLRVKILKIE